MKRFRIIWVLLALTAAPSRVYAVNWAAASNATLREEMLSFARVFRNNVRGEIIFDDLDRFIFEVDALAAQSPFAWMEQTHDFVTSQLRRYSPGFCLPSSLERNFYIRKQLLMLRDFPMHANNSASVSPAPLAGQAEAFAAATERYLGGARSVFLHWLDSPAPKEGCIEVFKVYNMGLVFRTSSKTVAIDIHWDGTAAEAARIASKLDLLLLSHNHSDHYSVPLMEEMGKAGKCLVLPTDKVPGYKDADRKYVMTETFRTPIDLDGIKVQGFLGEQNGTPCFVYVVDCDGWRFAHGGDNQVADAESNLSGIEAVDLATIAIFARPQSIMSYAMSALNRDSRDFIFLSTHENEKSHEVSGRIGFNQAFGDSNKFGSTSFNYPILCVLDCGEHITLSK